MFLITKILTCVVYRKISQTLSYLEYIRSLSSPLRDHGSRFARSLRSLNREVSDKYTLTITCITLNRSCKHCVGIYWSIW